MRLYFWDAVIWFLGCHCLVHPGARDKRGGSEIDLSQPRDWYSFLVTSLWASDVKIDRPNYVTYLSITFNSDLCTCTHTGQPIHDTKVSDIDTFIIMFDVFWYWCHWSLARRYALLRIANTRYDVTDKGTCNFAALPYLDDDCGTACHTLVSRYFLL